MQDLSHELNKAALQLAERLCDTDTKIVFAESCTGGLVAATLASIPGISRFLCGSAVTYRGATKVAWLNVNAADVERDSAVNAEVASQMAESVLNNTPESTLAVSITGHLGPDAPPHLDGVVYIGLASHSRTTCVSRHQLTTSMRSDRQKESVILVIQSSTTWINQL
jgi:nicotinamide-nucleotide amidase